MRDNKIVYSYRVATALIDKGFKVVDTQRNFKDMTKFVWFFERTPELEAAIAELSRK